MKKDLITIQGKLTVNASLSFKKFMEEVRRQLDTAEPYRRNFYAGILEEFEKHPWWQEPISPEAVMHEDMLLELIHIALFPPLGQQNTLFWGLSLPLCPTFFYGTDELYQLIKAENLEQWGQSVPDENEMTLGQLKLIYSYILQQCYHYAIVLNNQIVKSFTDNSSGLLKHYQINQDLRFVKVRIEGQLPELNFEILKAHMDEQKALTYLYQVLPLKRFHFEGFSVVTVSDITVPHILEKLKNEILREDHAIDTTYRAILEMLPSLVGTTQIHFGVLPFFELNKKLLTPFEMVSPFALHSYSGLLQAAVDFQVDPQQVSEELQAYQLNPQLVVEQISEPAPAEASVFYELFRKKGMKSFALIPVLYHDYPVGMLEVYTPQEGLLTNKYLTILEVAIPILGQLLQKHRQDFKASIDQIIRNKFTALQASVLWKFKEAAWHYLKKQLGNEQPEMETIRFKDVYPLFGSIDIRNSTLERNQALRQDLQVQFSLLLQTLEQLLQQVSLPLVEELVFRAARLQKSISPALTTAEEQNLTAFLEQEALPVLLELNASYPQAGTLIAPYLGAMNKTEGLAHQHRRRLETAMDMLTTAISNYLENMNAGLQQAHPCYFESLRTDGLEYDMYVGQSISPDKPFSLSALKNLRLGQLKAMAHIARITHALLPEMPVPLQTTQLIFIHGQAVDICFRNNERRFDVEGGANIRYQVIKKRIDKVHIASSTERLTQPGKIAMVYSDTRDVDQYLSYLQYLQEQQVLLDNLEYLELEQLQGIAGLKALRVGVNLAD